MAAGEIFTARIIETLGRGRALVDLGGDVQALLEKGGGLPQGKLLTVQMIRPPIPEPGRWKLGLVNPMPEEKPRSEAGWHQSEVPSLEYLLSSATKVDEIICLDAASANMVSGHPGMQGIQVSIDSDAIDQADFDGLIESAVTGEFPIEGGMLSIERTRAMTMIDIDGGGDPLALNIAAAREIPQLLRLLDIGGQIGIDFLALPDRKARLVVDTALAEACERLGPHERTAINGFGFAQIVRPRNRLSTLEILCGTTPGRLSVESRAIALLRDAGRTQGIGKRQLAALPVIIDLIRSWPDEIAALRSRLGVAIELVSDSNVSGYGHVHVSQS